MTKQNLQNHFKAIHFVEFLQEIKAKTAAASKQMPLPLVPPTTKLERAAKKSTPWVRGSMEVSMQVRFPYEFSMPKYIRNEIT